jgi:pimeloyl-ACP methyl ester carboxylesterase
VTPDVARVEAADGIRLHAEALGAGPLLLLSPGFCQTHENFRPQVEPFAAAGFRVVLWDYRGHGLSDAPEAPSAYSMERVVDDMVRVLAWADASAAPQRGGPAILGGLSFGGLASLHFALAHPGRVRALLLFASGPGFKNPEAQARWEAQVGRIADRLEERGFEGYVDGRAAATAIGRRAELPAAQAAGRAIVAQNPRAVAQFGRRVSGPAPSVIDELPRIEAPALVLVGAEDEAYLRAGEVMAARLPKARHVLIPGAGHVVNIEQAAAFNAAVLAFLASLPAEPVPGALDGPGGSS